MRQQDSICHFFYCVCSLFGAFIAYFYKQCFLKMWFLTEEILLYALSPLKKNLFLNFIFFDEFYNLFMHLNLYLIQLSQFSKDLPFVLIFYPIHLYVFLIFLVQCWLYVRHIQASRMMTMKGLRPRKVGLWNHGCCSDYIK